MKKLFSLLLMTLMTVAAWATDVTFDFDEDSYKNNVNKGKATVVVKGTGNYSGTKTITFTIGSKGILWWWRDLFN